MAYFNCFSITLLQTVYSLIFVDNKLKLTYSVIFCSEYNQTVTAVGTHTVLFDITVHVGG